jgi:hypothetical protein
MSQIAVIGLTTCLLAASMLYGQKPPESKDVIVFADGERLVGKFERSNGASVVFRSDVIGEITVDWSNVRELTTSQQFAVIPKGVVLKRNGDASKVPEGNIAFADQKVTVSPASGQPQTVAIAGTDHLIDKNTFEKELQSNPGFFHNWTGTVTAGASLVEATQVSKTFSGAIDLVRIVPDADWLRRRNRTIVAFHTAYGTLEQPKTPTVKTALYLAGFERDEYLSASVFAFGQASFSHNFSQGLQLQQNYSGGLGWSVIHRPAESFDLKAGVTYIRQEFYTSKSSESLAGSIFEEDFSRNLWRGARFTEQLALSPSWTNENAFTAFGNAALTLPAYKRLNFTLGTADNYLHDPPAGFRRNSFQATMGLTYSLR